MDCFSHLDHCFSEDMVQELKEMRLENFEELSRKLALHIGFVQPMEISQCPVYQCVVEDTCEKNKSSAGSGYIVTIVVIGVFGFIIVALLFMIIARKKQSYNPLAWSWIFDEMKINGFLKKSIPKGLL